jgi:hypothetical protein
LINEDGVIRGIDTETGTEVPVEFDDLATRSMETTEIDGPVSDGRTVTDLLGDGLEYASGAVRILSRIWNGSEIVADVNSSSVVTEEQNATTKYVGPGGKYDLLSEAYADLDASESNRYVLVLTENVTEPSKLDPESHIDVHGRGFRINSQEDNQAAVHFRGVRDCTWRDVTVDLRPGDTTGAFSALRFTSDKPPNEQTLRLHNVTGIGSTGGGKSHGVRVRHSSRPIFSDCLFISGREQGSIGGHVVHGAAPDFVGCDFYAISADVASGSKAGVLVRDASTATFRNCSAYGASGNDCNAWQIEGNAAPTLQGCHGGGPKFSGFTAGPGDDSFSPTDAAGFGTMESPIGASEFNAMLESITVNIYNGVNGGTIDIGTTRGGTEIASDVDASSADRVNFDYNRVSIDPGDTWYVTTSHSSVDYGLRWTVRRTRFEASGLALSSRGPAKINGGTFLGGPKAAGAKIHPGSDRRYSINGATFVTDSDTRAAVSSSADDGVDEPIRNCTFVNTTGGSGDEQHPPADERRGRF